MIVSIPDFCTLTYFSWGEKTINLIQLSSARHNESMSQLFWNIYVCQSFYSKGKLKSETSLSRTAYMYYYCKYSHASKCFVNLY